MQRVNEQQKDIQLNFFFLYGNEAHKSVASIGGIALANLYENCYKIA